jgi:outer membrane protein OmpA-like peptidoglycan-associated protein
MFRLLLPALAISLVLLALSPASARAQVIDRIRRQTQEKLEAKKQAAEEKVVTATGQVVDSVAEKSARGVDTVVTRSTNALSTAVEKTEQVVTSVVSGDGSDAALARQLEAGHVTLADLQFASDGEVAASSLPVLRSIAKLMKDGESVWIIEAHTAGGQDDQARSDLRARAVKAVLVSEGVPAARIFARGLGSSRPITGLAASDRVELVRMQ